MFSRKDRKILGDIIAHMKPFHNFRTLSISDPSLFSSEKPMDWQPFMKLVANALALNPSLKSLEIVRQKASLASSTVVEATIETLYNTLELPRLESLKLDLGVCDASQFYRWWKALISLLSESHDTLELIELRGPTEEADPTEELSNWFRSSRFTLKDIWEPLSLSRLRSLSLKHIYGSSHCMWLVHIFDEDTQSNISEFRYECQLKDHTFKSVRSPAMASLIRLCSFMYLRGNVANMTISKSTDTILHARTEGIEASYLEVRLL